MSTSAKGTSNRRKRAKISRDDEEYAEKLNLVRVTDPNEEFVRRNPDLAYMTDQQARDLLKKSIVETPIVPDALLPLTDEEETETVLASSKSLLSKDPKKLFDDYDDEDQYYEDASLSSSEEEDDDEDLDYLYSESGRYSSLIGKRKKKSKSASAVTTSSSTSSLFSESDYEKDLHMKDVPYQLEQEPSEFVTQKRFAAPEDRNRAEMERHRLQTGNRMEGRNLLAQMLAYQARPRYLPPPNDVVNARFRQEGAELQDRVVIDDRVVLETYTRHAHNPLLYGMIRKLSSHLIGNGVTIVFHGLKKQDSKKLKSKVRKQLGVDDKKKASSSSSSNIKGGKPSLDPSEAEDRDDDDGIDISVLCPRFAQHELQPLVIDWLMWQTSVGLNVYSKTPSKYLRGMDIPVIVRKAVWRVEYGFWKHQRVWQVYDVTRVGQQGHTGINQLMEDAYVSSIYPPKHEDTIATSGRGIPQRSGVQSGCRGGPSGVTCVKLASPFYDLKDDIERLTSIWQDVTTAVGHGSHPDMVVETPAPTGASGGRHGGSGASASSGSFDPATVSIALPGDLLELQSDYVSELNQVNREQYQDAVDVSKLKNKGFTVIPPGARRYPGAAPSSSAAAVDTSVSEQEARERSEALRYHRMTQTWQDPIILPIGQRVTNTPMPSLPSDTRDYINMLVIKIANSIGVPPHSPLNESNRHAANAELHLRDLNDPIKLLQRLAEGALTEMFENVWREHLQELRDALYDQSLKEIMEDEEIGPILDNQDIRNIDIIIHMMRQAISDRVRIEVKFNHTPLTSRENLKALYDDHVISHETFALRSLSVSGLPQTDLAPLEDRLRFTKARNAELEAAYTDSDYTIRSGGAPVQTQQQKPGSSSSSSSKTAAAGQNDNNKNKKDADKTSSSSKNKEKQDSSENSKASGSGSGSNSKTKDKGATTGGSNSSNSTEKSSSSSNEAGMDNAAKNRKKVSKRVQ